VKRAIAALLALVCAGCASTPPPAPDAKTQLPALEVRIFELINERRAAIDPKARQLALDSELVGLARQRSLDMAAKNGFDAVSADPHMSATRLMAEDAAFQGLLGENVAAQRYDKTTGLKLEQCATSIVEIWIKSPRHRDNLSYADYVRTGVGAAVSNDTVFVTQLFATPLATLKATEALPAPRLRGSIGNP